MGLPNILIEFKSKASTAIKRGERGIVAIIVVDETHGVTKIEDITQIPDGLTPVNKAYIERCFLGGVKPVRSVVLIVSDTVQNGLKVLETQKFDYVVGPHDMESEAATAMATFVKGLRDTKGIKVKAVLPNTKGDHEGIINFTTDNIVVGENTFTTAQYCSRIAGLLAGTPLQQSATYYQLSEVDDVPKFTKAELDKKIDAGEFVIFHDGEKVKVARAVNSLTTCEDSYIGKFANNYDNKCNLIVSIQAYLESLRNDELLDQDIYTGIDMASQTNYLKGKNEPVEDMSEQEIKEANTQTFVFLESRFKILNAIEDIQINFFI